MKSYIIIYRRINEIYDGDATSLSDHLWISFRADNIVWNILVASTMASITRGMLRIKCNNIGQYGRIHMLDGML